MVSAEKRFIQEAPWACPPHTQADLPGTQDADRDSAGTVTDTDFKNHLAQKCPQDVLENPEISEF